MSANDCREQNLSTTASVEVATKLKPWSPPVLDKLSMKETRSSEISFSNSDSDNDYS